MAVRCDYCGQLYDGLSCPHCGAPRGEEKKPSGITTNESGITINGDCNQVVISSGNNSVVSVSQTINGNSNVSVLGNDNTIFADGKVYWTDDWAKWSEQMDQWSEQMDPEWNPEEDPDNVDYFLVDVDPYKDEPAPKVGVPRPVEEEGGPLDGVAGNLAAIAMFGLACAALMLFWWLFSKL